MRPLQCYLDSDGHLLSGRYGIIRHILIRDLLLIESVGVLNI